VAQEILREKAVNTVRSASGPCFTGWLREFPLQLFITEYGKELDTLRWGLLIFWLLRILLKWKFSRRGKPQTGEEWIDNPHWGKGKRVSLVEFEVQVW